MISTNAFAPREIFKNPRVFSDFHGFRHSKMFEIWVSKIIEKPFKILPESIKNRSRNWFEKHIQKTCEKILPTAFKMAPKSFKIEARRAQNHPATPLGLARLPRPPQTRPRPPFGPISASILMNFVPKTDAQRPKKQNKAKYFH